MNSIISIAEIANRIRCLLTDNTTRQEPVVLDCNYSDDYYGDKVCVKETRR